MGSVACEFTKIWGYAKSLPRGVWLYFLDGHSDALLGGHVGVNIYHLAFSKGYDSFLEVRLLAFDGTLAGVAHFLFTTLAQGIYRFYNDLVALGYFFLYLYFVGTLIYYKGVLVLTAAAGGLFCKVWTLKYHVGGA